MRALVVMVVIAACGQPAVAANTGVHVDRRVELVSLVERLAGSPEYNPPPNTAYTADLVRTFGKFASHPAIALARELHGKGVAYEQAMFFAIHLDDPHRSAALRAIDPRWNAIDADAFATAVQQFAHDADFEAFWNQHHAYIQQVEQRFSGALASEHPAPWFAELFGPSKLPFELVPALGNGPQNYGVRSTTALFQMMGVGVPGADGLPVIDDVMRELIVHEMAHSFVNPVIERHLKELEPVASPLFALVAPQMRAQAYNDVKIMLFESCVRALTTLYARDRHGADAGADAARRQVRLGFLWTAGLADMFAAFRAGHTHDLDAFAPRLVEFFAAAHDPRPLPFAGPIDSVITGDISMIAAADPALAAYVAGIHQKILPRATIGKPAALDAVPSMGLMVYGTTASNPMIAELAKRAGWKLADGDFELGAQRFTGPGLVAIACWPRGKADPLHGVVVYAGARDADVVGIHSVHAGGTDWVIARKLPDGSFQTLAQGDFHVDANGSWRLP